MRKKFIYLVVFIFFFICIYLVSENQTGVPEDELVGVWSGECELFLRLSENADNSNKRDSVDVELTISEDGVVTGYVGKAVLEDCVYKSNRGWLGSFLNIKTDHIIQNGVLMGLLSSKDKDTEKMFTMPFNIKDGNIKGTIMQIYKFKYPDPLVKIKLKKIK